MLQQFVHVHFPDGKQRVLDVMNGTISTPRPSYKDNSPVLKELNVPLEQQARLLGSGGVNLRKLKSDVGVSVSGLGEGKYQIFAPNQEAHNEAMQRINELLAQDVRAPLQ